MKIIFNIPVRRKFLALALLIRFLVMPFFYHPDIKTYHFQSSFLKKGVINIYKYLLDNRAKLPIKEEFVYLPGAYLFLGGYQFIVSPIMGQGFDNWLSDASQESFSTIGFNRYLFVLKLPYLLFDFLTLVVLLRFIKKDKLKKKLALIWLFNPFTIALLYVFSNIDVVATFFLLYSVFILRKRTFVAGLIMGLAASIKLYPIIALPFILVSLGSVRKVVLYILGVLTSFLILIMPFWSKEFVASAFVSGLTTRITSFGLNLGFGDSIFIPIVLLALIFLYYQSASKKLPLITILSALFIILVSAIHYHIQWLYWGMPFLAVTAVKKNMDLKYLSALLSFGFLVSMLYMDKYMNVGVMVPFSSLYMYLPTLNTVFSKFIDPGMVMGTIHSIFLSFSLFYVYKIFTKKIK